MTMTSLLNNVLFSGASDQIKRHLSRRIVFSNVIFLTLVVVYVTFILMDFQVYLQWPGQLKIDQLTIPMMVLYCLLGLYLNRIGFSYISRVLLVVLWPLFMHIIPIILLQTPADYYLAFPIGIIFHAVLIQLVISFRSEKITYYTLMALNFLMILYAKEILLTFDHEADAVSSGGVVGSVYYTLVAILYWLLFNAITFYVTRVLDRLIDKNDSQHTLLKQNNHVLLELNRKIEHTNRSLEYEVKKRTSELQKTNVALTSYAYYNAHQIRGPFCRIKGILMLRKLKAIDPEDFDCKMDLSLQQLEDAINQMQEHLNEVDERN
jgi:hypothetical protein